MLQFAPLAKSALIGVVGVVAFAVQAGTHAVPTDPLALILTTGIFAILFWQSRQIARIEERVTHVPTIDDMRDEIARHRREMQKQMERHIEKCPAIPELERVKNALRECPHCGKAT